MCKRLLEDVASGKNITGQVKVILAFCFVCIGLFLGLLYLDVSKIQKISEPIITDDMHARLDEFKEQNGVLELRGWGFCEGIDTRTYELKVILYQPDTDQYLLVPSAMEKRDDVWESYKEDSDENIDYSYSGFYTKLKCNKLSAMGLTYEVCLGWGEEIDHFTHTGQYITIGEEK